MKSFINALEKKWWTVQAFIYSFYCISHLLFLTALPVFADESIYIRWSQLILDDWQRYAFFALNDGKTPLFIWLMVPFLELLKNQLFAGRLLSVIVGVFQIWAVKSIIEQLNGQRVAQCVGMILTTVLPFWFFYHRMALMDGLLTLFISLTFLCLVRLVQALDHRQSKSYLPLALITGLSFGLAILTKLPALFFGTIFVLFALYPFSNKKYSLSFQKIYWIGFAGFIGCTLFLLLKIHPAFGQLFARGKDFTYSTQDLLQGDWVKSISNIRIFSTWFLYYFSPFLLIFIVCGLGLKELRKISAFLIISTLFFWGPFIVFGRVVYPRYLLPSVLFLTVLIALVSEKGFKAEKHFQKIIFISLFSMIGWSFYYMGTSLLYADGIPFLPVDRLQYLTEWSSGHGVTQAVSFIQEKAKSGRVLVVTEGYFGTLPDAVLMNLHNQDVTNIEVWGIGAPVRVLPENFEEKSKQFDMTILLVNSHRMFVLDPRFQKIASYPRPYGAPSFDIYEFSPYEKN